MTVDRELVDAGRRAVADGDADSVSAWVGEALAEKVQRDHKLALLAAAVRDYEEEHGVITDEEIAAIRRSDRAGARVVRGPRSA